MVNVSNKHPFAFTAARLRDASDAAGERQAREKVVSPTDGRVRRSKGKTVNVNYRVTPAFKRDLQEIARATGVTMTEILERALETYKQTRPRKP